ncbi:MAG: IS110 family transposase, partial [Proteobacteria bacterium]|nr:IS110 family transposase [Pseudomonadota bacterium]
MVTHHLGIDIAKHKFDVALLVGDTFKMNAFENNSKGFEQLLAWLKTESNVSSCHACLESTGQYGDALAEFLFDHHITVSVVNPAQIKGFAISLLSRNKTDKTDAQLIAKFCKATNPYHWHPETTLIKELKALVRRVNDLKAIVQQEKSRLEFAGETVKKSIETIISCLESEMKSLEKQLAHCIETDTDLKEKYRALKSIPGISDRTISRILSLCADIEKFNSAKQLAAYAGLNAHHHQSGSTVKEKSRLSKMGHVEFRQ